MRRLSLLSVLAVATLVGCRTTKDVLDDYETNISYGKYADAVNEPAELAAKNDRDALCWQLHAAGAEHLTANLDEAIRRFDLAEDKFAEFDGRTALGQTGDSAYSMMTGDYVRPYAGSGHERVFTCLYKAIDFGAEGNVAAVRTELNRAAQHQENWLDDCRADIAEAGERLKQDAETYRKQNNSGGNAGTATDTTTSVDQAMADASFSEQIKAGCGFDPLADGRLETLSTKDYMNVYALSVCGLFRWLVGDNDGKKSLGELVSLKPDNAMLRADLALAGSGVRPRDMVWVFVEDGLCPRLEEWRLDLPLVLIPGLNRYVMYAGMALPKLKPRNEAVTAYSVAGGGATVQMPELESIDRLLKTEYDVAMRGVLAREITRVIVKAGVQIALGVAAENVSDSNTRLVLRVSQAGAAAWAASVTGADIRSWTGLPKRVCACRVARPADGALTVNCGLEQVQIKVPEGNSLVFVRKTSSAAPSVVKTLTLPN